MKIGDYVKVVKVPDPWEGAGESDSDRESLLGHVGVIVEVGAVDDLALVRFPSVGYYDEETGQRNIETSALEIVAPAPPRRIYRNLFLN